MLFKDLPIQQKLMRIIGLVSGLVLFVTCVTFYTYEFFKFRQTSREKLSTIGQIIARNGTAALAFKNRDDAADILTSLNFESHIVAACFYDTSGRIFAKYPADIDISALPGKPDLAGYHFSDSYLQGFEPVVEVEGTHRLGTLYLKSDLKDMYDRFLLYGFVTAGVIIISLVLVYKLSGVLQKSISTPLLTLAATAKVISEKKDYSVRAAKLGNDEVGSLTDAFNQMLVQIQQQARTLNEFNQKLEQKIVERTNELEVANNELRIHARQLRASEKEIRQTNKFLDSILNNIPNMIFVKDAKELRFVSLNKAGEKMLGHSREELIGKNDYDFFPKEQADAFTAKDHEVIEKKGVFDIPEEPIQTQKGQRWLHTQKIPITDEKDEPVYLLGISEDITERKKAETRIRESEERFRLMVEGVKDYAIILTDANGNITNWNQGAERIKGYKAEEIIGKNISTFYTPDELERNEPQHNLQMAREKGHHQFEGWRVRKDGTLFWANVVLSALYDENNQIKGFSKITRDMTERKRIDEALQTKSEELARSNRELEQFAYVASHDLQEPLRMVSSFLQLLEKKLGDGLDKDSKEYLDFAVDGSMRMRNMINDLLSYSRILSGKVKFEKADINQILEDVKSNLKETIAESNADITWGKMPVTPVDKIKLARLFQNLIANGIKFHAKNVIPALEINCKEQSSDYLFSVKDNGIGIKKEYLDKIFIIFQRLHSKQEYPGTGIGLAECKKIVELHDGKIWAESEPGKGSTFYFTIKKYLS